MKIFTTAILATLFLAGGAYAADRSAPVDEILKLEKSGVGDDVIVAWIDTQSGWDALDTNTILKLKDLKLSDRVLAALVRGGGRDQLVVQSSQTRYVAPSNSTPTAREYVQPQDYQQAQTSYPSTTYSYVQPATYTYATPTYYTYPSTYYYPSYSYYYPYYGGYYYPRYYGGYYGRGYYGGYYGSGISFNFGFGGFGHGGSHHHH